MKYAGMVLAGMLAAVISGCSFDPGGYTDGVAPADVDGAVGEPSRADAGIASIDANAPPPPDATPPPMPKPDAGCPTSEALCRESGELVCVDLQADDRNCGECGKRCGGSEACVDGECDDGD